MPPSFQSAEEFRAAAKDGQRPEGMVLRFNPSEPETVGEAKARTKRFTFSDGSVDLAGDVIHQDGWDLTNFKRNPVALFCHCSWDPPIGRASDVAVSKGKLAGDIEFASADVYPFADTIYRLVDGGFMKAVSVGFVPTEWSFTSDKNRPYGIDFKKQLLSEISVCPLPCNPNALEQARSAGIDTRGLVEWAEKVLDNGDTVMVPRGEIEALRLQAKTAPAPRFYIQAKGTVTAEIAQRIRDDVRRAEADPTEVLILPEGFEVRGIAPTRETIERLAIKLDIDAAALEEKLAALKAKMPDASVISAIDNILAGDALLDTVDKAGRKISAATKATLAEAMTHHEAMGACIKGLMGDDGDGEDGEPDGDDADEPIDSVKSIEPLADEDENLTPEERRLKEAKAIRDSLKGDDQ